MISIKKFLERRGESAPDHDVQEAALQMCRLLLDGVATHVVRGRDDEVRSFRQTLRKLISRLGEHPSAFGLLEISSDAVEAMETYAQRAEDYVREGNEQMQSMVAMLTDTVAELSGQTDASIGRLQSIERQIENASGLDDIRLLRGAMGNCLAAVREAAAQQRLCTAGTVERLENHIQTARERRVVKRPHPAAEDCEIELSEPAVVTAAADTRYVAAFRLQRAEHIASRFGENARNQMLSLISQNLKAMLGPNDRLLRWKGTSFVMFLTSMDTQQQVRARIGQGVTSTGQHFIEVGRKSALLSVGVDWIVFPEAQCGSLEAVFAEVDAFLSSTRGA